MMHHHRSSVVAGLREALPYLRLFRKKTFCIKAGGELFADEAATTALTEQVSVLHALGIRVVVVHGGGPQTSRLTARLGEVPRMVGGRRVTDAIALDASKCVLNGSLATDVVASFRASGVLACRVSGVDGGLVDARVRPPQVQPDGTAIDFGEVGDVVSVDPSLLERLLDDGFVPVVSPLSADASGRVLNINADTVAAEMAIALGAEKLILMTSAPGILADPADPESLVSYLDVGELRAMREEGLLRGGMLPKSVAIERALERGVPRAHVISYSLEDGLLLEIFSNEGCGSLVELEKDDHHADLSMEAGS